jgi:hypothetical protein
LCSASAGTRSGNASENVYEPAEIEELLESWLDSTKA